jgi:hypothetical protein
MSRKTVSFHVEKSFNLQDIVHIVYEDLGEQGLVDLAVAALQNMQDEDLYQIAKKKIAKLE